MNNRAQPLFRIKGIVKEGAKRGKNLGFPTANMLFSESLPDGIYISQTIIGNTTFQSVTFIGAAITYNEVNRKAETYILDFNEDLYTKEITVNLLQKIRDNEKFESEEKLIAQMIEDIKYTRKYFSTSL